jgi:hypothetical protein
MLFLVFVAFIGNGSALRMTSNGSDGMGSEADNARTKKSVTVDLRRVPGVDILGMCANAVFIVLNVVIRCSWVGAMRRNVWSVTLGVLVITASVYHAPITINAHSVRDVAVAPVVRFVNLVCSRRFSSLRFHPQPTRR